MNITLENTGTNTATIKIEMAQEDYQEKVDLSLKDIQKKAVIHGFRPGKVPIGLIKKLHNKAVIAEEVNKVLSEALYNYLQDSKLDIIGHPIENPDKNEKIDIESQKDFAFYFDVGIVPEFSVALSKDTTVDYFDIKVDESDIDEQEKSLRNKYGTQVHADEAQEDDIIKGEITELDADGNPKEKGISNNTVITPRYIKEDKVREAFTGLKKGESVTFNPVKAIGNDYEVASLLNVKKEQVAGINSDFRFVAEEISRLEPAEPDSSFFGKVYPNEDIESYEEFRARIKNDLKEYYQRESDSFFTHSSVEKLVEGTEMELPVDFLKRWLLETDKNLTEEIVENNFGHYAQNFRQDLILERIAKENDLKVSDEEVRNHILNWFGGYSQEAEESDLKARMNAIADKFMENDDEKYRIRNQLFDQKLRATLKEKLNVEIKEVTYSEFSEIVMQHNKSMHHEH